MQAKLTVNGLNLFLTRIFDEETRLSVVLSRLGFSSQQVEELRRHYLDHIVIFCIDLIDERLMADRNGERLSHIVKRRFGLDGSAPETLEGLGQQLGISRERVRQLQDKGIRKCKSVRWQRLWKEQLRSIAMSLVGESGEILLVPPHAVIAGSNGVRNQDGATQIEVEPGSPFSQTDMDLVANLTASILATTGGSLSTNILSHILAGSTGPIVEALVAYYKLPQYGVLKALTVDQVKRLIQATQATNKAKPKSVPRAEMERIDIDIDDSMIDEFIGTIQSIVNAIGYMPSRHILVHVLYGSTGPVVDELVARHNLAQYGCLKRLGFSTVKRLVGDLDLSSLSRDSASWQGLSPDIVTTLPGF